MSKPNTTIKATYNTNSVDIDDINFSPVIVKRLGRLLYIKIRDPITPEKQTEYSLKLQHTITLFNTINLIVTFIGVLKEGYTLVFRIEEESTIDDLIIGNDL